MTQKELAYILNVSPQFLSKWKLGRSGLRVSTAVRWSAILNVDFKVLMCVGPDPAARSKLLGIKKNRDINHVRAEQLS